MTFAEALPAILAHFGLTEAPILGEGGEGIVVGFGSDRVLKIYRQSDRAYLESLATFQARIASFPLPYATPRIAEIHCVHSLFCCIEPRLPGVPMQQVFPALPLAEQQKLLVNFLDALPPLHASSVPDLPFGQVLDTPGSLTAESWEAFLHAKITQRLIGQEAHLRQGFPDLPRLLEWFTAATVSLPPITTKAVVHGDYFPANVLIDSELRISAVLDFSPHTVIGDYRLDIVGAIAFLDLLDDFTPEHIAYVTDLALDRYGDELAPVFDLYRVYYSLYYADSWQYDPVLYAWCLRGLHLAASRWLL